MTHSDFAEGGTAPESEGEPSIMAVPYVGAPNSKIAMADGNAGATIYYTTNGDIPTTSSPKYATPIAAGSAGTAAVTIKAFAIAQNQSPSNTVVGTFTPATAASTSTLTCSADNRSVTFAPATLNDIVFYTTDGTVPSRSSNSITASTTVSFSSTSKPIQAVEVGYATSLSSVVSKTCP